MRSETETPSEVSADVVFEILSNERRRMILYSLRHSAEPCTIQEVAEEIAALENGVAVEDLTSQQRKRVYVSLYQTHIPKLADSGIIDDDDGTVRLTDRALQIDSYLTAPVRSTYPWGKHYFALSALGGILLALAIVGIPGVVTIPTSGLGVLLFLTFGLSATVQYWNRRQQRREVPTELLEHGN